MKMKPAFLFVAMTIGLTSASHANTYVQCGKSVDMDSFEVSGYELELSSENGDGYQGRVGGTWNLKLGSIGAQWLGANKNITARTIESDDTVNVEVTIKMANTASGPVGTMYVLKDLYADSPVLEKYTIGGFVGKRLIETLQCYSGND